MKLVKGGIPITIETMLPSLLDGFETIIRICEACERPSMFCVVLQTRRSPENTRDAISGT